MSTEPYEAITATFTPEAPAPAPAEEAPAVTTEAPVEAAPEATPATEPATPEAPVEAPVSEEPAPTEAAAEDTESEAPAAEGDAEQAVADEIGLSVQDLADEFLANGSQWSEETTAKLIEGVSRLFGVEADAASQLVADFAEGKRAQAQVMALDLYSVIGGEDQYPALRQWAVSNLTPDQLAAHDRVVANAQAANDLEGMKDALRSLKSQYEANVGTPRNVVESHGAPPSNEPPIMSVQELATVKASAEYKSDPNFRARVSKRLAAGMATGRYRN